MSEFEQWVVKVVYQVFLGLAAAGVITLAICLWAVLSRRFKRPAAGPPEHYQNSEILMKRYREHE